MWRGGAPYDTNIPSYIEGTYHSDSQGMKHFCMDRHNGAINLTFMDMSAREVELKELWNLKWHKNFKTGQLRDYSWPEWVEDVCP